VRERESESVSRVGRGPEFRRARTVVGSGYVGARVLYAVLGRLCHRQAVSRVVGESETFVALFWIRHFRARA
jgi:hypothetical protein